MNNTARIYDLSEYRDKIGNKTENEKTMLEMMQSMMDKINNLEQQLKESSPKTKKEVERIEHNGNVVVKREYSKIALSEEQISIIENTFIDYIKKEDAYMKSRYKLYMYYILQLNCGLRISDCLSLRYCNLIDKIDLDHGYISFRREIGADDVDGILERKTINSRNERVNRHVTINNNIKRVLSLYLNKFKDTKMDDYLFPNNSTNSNGLNKPCSKQAIDNALKVFTKRSGLSIVCNSHNLRRSWARNYYMQQGATHEALVELQLALNHSSTAMTIKYLGLSKEKISDGYLNNTLGMKSNIEEQLSKF